MFSKPMTSRERALTAIDRREADRIPIDISAVDEVMDALIDYFEIKDEDKEERKLFMGADGTLVERRRFEAQLKLLDRLHVDFRWAWAPYIGPDLSTYPDGSRDGFFGIKRGGLFFGYALEHPLKEARTIKEIDSYPWECYTNLEHYDYDRYALECRRFHEEGYAVYGGPWAPISFWAMDLMGMDTFLMAMYDNPSLVERLLSHISGFYYEQARIMFEKGQGFTDIFFMGDDYGMQSCPLMHPRLWRRFIAPHLERLWGLAKSFGLKVQLHSCGSIRELVPDFIDRGVDVLDPIQVKAKGMTPEDLKEQFGNKLAFHGSMDTQETLPFGTPEDVRREVIHRLRTLAPGGGFILSPSQHLLTEIPLENIVTLYDAAYELGSYRNIHSLS